MAAFIEQRLNDRVQSASDSDRIEAVIVVSEREDAPPVDDDSGLVHQVVDIAVQRTGESPEAVRYFPRANAVVLTASRRFLLEILQDEGVAAASTTSIAMFPFSALT